MQISMVYLIVKYLAQPLMQLITKYLRLTWKLTPGSTLLPFMIAWPIINVFTFLHVPILPLPSIEPFLLPLLPPSSLHRALSLPPFPPSIILPLPSIEALSSPSIFPSLPSFPPFSSSFYPFPPLLSPSSSIPLQFFCIFPSPLPVFSFPLLSLYLTSSVYFYSIPFFSPVFI